MDIPRKPSPTLAKLLETLKDKLVQGKDLKEIMNYFLDELGEHPLLLEHSRRISSPLFYEILNKTIAVFKFPKIHERDSILLDVPGYSFLHGSLFFGERKEYFGTLLYFRDIATGVLAISAYPPTHSPAKTVFLRIAVKALITSPEKGSPFRDSELDVH